ncbi:hypothetical protein [Azoarcus sp. DN11]|uniref:hypothetical protein n=1 Tax=Azoarcus sp. DN11 TaxID=356837 RepID=UPI000EAE5567|nr:hypothetical protein [Azoarcus sp. DN11]AYH43253.1 hypothetical protein CDA09_07615 [Azoarcus sp. DN11]
MNLREDQQLLGRHQPSVRLPWLLRPANTPATPRREKADSGHQPARRSRDATTNPSPRLPAPAHEFSDSLAGILAITRKDFGL